jgi:hypothetical protein
MISCEEHEADHSTQLSREKGPTFKSEKMFFAGRQFVTLTRLQELDLLIVLAWNSSRKHLISRLGRSSFRPVFNQGRTSWRQL